MKDKDKFKFANKTSQTKDDFLIEDDIVVEESAEEKEKQIEDSIRLLRQKKIRRLIITIITLTLFTGAVFSLSLLWHMRFDLMGFTNALWLTFALIFFVAWIMFVYNRNILSPFIHGMKVFGLMFVGKRTKESYYEYSQRIKENPIPKYVYIPTFINAGIVLVPTIVLTILVM